MSIITLTAPLEAAATTLPVFGRSVLGFGVFGVIVSLTLTFKPMLKGLFRAVMLMITRPAASLEGGRAAAIGMLQRLAKDFEQTQPDQAAELRWLASRG